MTLAAHWDAVYTTKDTRRVSWYQPVPHTSLQLIDQVARPGDGIVDVGAGASTLVDHLLARGHTDLTVVDISQVALDLVRGRIGTDRVAMVQADVRDWTPARTWVLWHDRAVCHFLSHPTDLDAYRHALLTGLQAGGHAIVSAFHVDGPDRCSDLPTTRYDAPGLLSALGGEQHFELVHQQVELHPHPRGGTQAFQVVVLRRRPAPPRDAGR